MIEDLGFNEIKDLLNDNHHKYGYPKSMIGKMVSMEYGFPLDIKYKEGYYDARRSTIEVNGHIFSVDDLTTFLLSKNVIEVKTISIPVNGVGRARRARRWFTTDYKGYQKNKKRREAINKVLSNKVGL